MNDKTLNIYGVMFKIAVDNRYCMSILLFQSQRNPSADVDRNSRVHFRAEVCSGSAIHRSLPGMFRFFRYLIDRKIHGNFYNVSSIHRLANYFLCDP